MIHVGQVEGPWHFQQPERPGTHILSFRLGILLSFCQEDFRFIRYNFWPFFFSYFHIYTVWNFCSISTAWNCYRDDVPPTTLLALIQHLMASLESDTCKVILLDSFLRYHISRNSIVTQLFYFGYFLSVGNF